MYILSDYCRRKSLLNLDVLKPNIRLGAVHGKGFAEVQDYNMILFITGVRLMYVYNLNECDSLLWLPHIYDNNTHTVQDSFTHQ